VLCLFNASKNRFLGAVKQSRKSKLLALWLTQVKYLSLSLCRFLGEKITGFQKLELDEIKFQGEAQLNQEHCCRVTREIGSWFVERNTPSPVRVQVH